MRVRLWNKFVDSNDEPIMIILTPEEKELISNMGDQTEFCSYPKNLNPDVILKFMKGNLG